MYDASNPSQFSEEDCEDAVGKHATLPLTGTIVEAGESGSGPYVKFEVDGRWGFSEERPFRLVLDLDALVLADPSPTQHPKMIHGQCPVCGHYGDDCTGAAATATH